MATSGPHTPKGRKSYVDSTGNTVKRKTVAAVQTRELMIKNLPPKQQTERPDPAKKKFRKRQLIADRLYGHIDITDYQVWIDQREFQRLKRINQLGTAHTAYPCAQHTRFEHCLGTMNLARLLCQFLVENSGGAAIGDLIITKRDTWLVGLAALYHDLGHAAFSHLWDDNVLQLHTVNKASEAGWCHEVRSGWLMESVAKRIRESSEPGDNNYMTDTEIKFVKSLIHPEAYKDWISGPDFKSLGGEYYGKDCLYQIVSNHISAMDVDKLDYLLRDSQTCGGLGIVTDLKIIKRIFGTAVVIARVADPTVIRDDQKLGHEKDSIVFEISYARKCSRQIAMIFHDRYSMHRMCYKHKTTDAATTMVGEIFKEANKYFKWNPQPLGDLTDEIMTQFVQITDDVLRDVKTTWQMYQDSLKPGARVTFNRMSDEERKGLEDANRLLDRIEERKYYKFVSGLDTDLKEMKKIPDGFGEKAWLNNVVAAEEIAERMEEVMKERDEEVTPQAKNISVTGATVKVSGGLDLKYKSSPSELIWFYNRDELNDEQCNVEQLENIEISRAYSALPGEYRLRLYVTVREDDAEYPKIKARAFEAWKRYEKFLEQKKMAFGSPTKKRAQGEARTGATLLRSASKLDAAALSRTNSSSSTIELRIDEYDDACQRLSFDFESPTKEEQGKDPEPRKPQDPEPGSWSSLFWGRGGDG